MFLCDDNIAAGPVTTHDVIARSRTITNFLLSGNSFPTALLQAGDIIQRMRAMSRHDTHIWSSQQRRADRRIPRHSRQISRAQTTPPKGREAAMKLGTAIAEILKREGI